MFRISPRVQDFALDCTLFATSTAIFALPYMSALVNVSNKAPDLSKIDTPLKFISALSAIIYRDVITKTLPNLLKKETLQQARWTFWQVGSVATAVITSLAILAFKGSFTPWGIYGLGLQAGFSIAVGSLYTRLVNRWAVNLLNDRVTQWTPERTRDVVRGADKDVLTSRLTEDVANNIHFLDQYVQRDDVMPDEIAPRFEDHISRLKFNTPGDKGTISEKTLDKLLQAKNNDKLLKALLNFTFNDPDRQLQIMKRSPLGHTYIYTMKVDSPSHPNYSTDCCAYPTLNSKTAERLLHNPSIWDLVIIHQDQLENKLDNIDDDQLLELILDEMSYPWEKSPIQLVINWLPAKKLETFLKNLQQKNLFWFRCAFVHILHGKTHQSEENLVPLIRNIAATTQVECFLASYKKPKPIYGITFADACSHFEDIDNQRLASFFMYYYSVLDKK